MYSEARLDPTCQVSGCEPIRKIAIKEQDDRSDCRSKRKIYPHRLRLDATMNKHMPHDEAIGFEISVSGRDDGTLEAAYIRFRMGDVATTKELEEDTLIADYDADGNLLGVEILAPVQLSHIERLVDRQRRPAFRVFVKKNTCDLVECG
jgi:uncharacterized protein YuzE